jgi:hypothetical protein
VPRLITVSLKSAVGFHVGHYRVDCRGGGESVRVAAVVVGSPTSRPPRVCAVVSVAVDVAVWGAAWVSISNSSRIAISELIATTN